MTHASDEVTKIVWGFYSPPNLGFSDTLLGNRIDEDEFWGPVFKKYIVVDWQQVSLVFLQFVLLQF